MAQKSVLVTGGAGFIGSHTTNLLVECGYYVRVMDNLSPPVHAEGASWPEWLHPDAERMRGDVRVAADWRDALDGVDCVIHLAAHQDLLPTFGKFFHTNAVGTALLYEAIVADKLPVQRVVVASSQFVYGEGRYECERCGIVFPNNRTRQSLDGGHWDPACPTCDGTIAPLPLLELHANPQNQYSISKFTQELTAICLGRNYGIPSTALRYSIVHGPFQSYRNAYSGALRVFTLELLKGKRPPIFEDGLQLRDYVNVSDVAAANVLALESEELVGQVVNVGGGKGYTVLELAALIADELSVEMQIEPHGEYRVGDTRHSVSDISKLNRVGWRPTKTLRNNVKEYVEWIRNQEMDRDYVSEALALLRTSGALRSISSGSS